MKLDLADFAAFCRSKGSRTYDYHSNCGCAVATYLVEAKGMVAGYGANTFSVGGGHVSVRGADHRTVEHRFDDGVSAALHVGNYRDLADRLEALLPAAPASQWASIKAYLPTAVEQPA